MGPLTEHWCCRGCNHSCAPLNASTDVKKSSVIQQEEASATAGAETFTSRARTQPGSGRQAVITPLLLEGLPGRPKETGTTLEADREINARSL